MAENRTFHPINQHALSNDLHIHNLHRIPRQIAILVICGLDGLYVKKIVKNHNVKIGKKFWSVKKLRWSHKITRIIHHSTRLDEFYNLFHVTEFEISTPSFQNIEK